MRWKQGIAALGLTSALLPPLFAYAADHRDGAAVLADPSTDLNDVYAWVSGDGSKVYLVMTMFPAADKNTSKFSNAAYYVFHTASRASFNTTATTPLDIICGFDATQKISCWIGTKFVFGDASSTAGLSSSDGKVRVYAGVRKDHFFFNLDGFNDVRATVKGRHAVTPLTFDANGCANNLTAGELSVIRNQLQKTAAGASPPVDFFKDLNTLAIVMEVDKALLTAGGPILGVWGATHKTM